MSTITGIVYVNPIEPGPLSMRVPTGVETRLNLTFLDQLSRPISTDLLAQIELTSRSRANTPVWMAVPATDIVNGKATAVFPANVLTDPNGYRLRLYGSVNGEGMLLATGVVAITEAIGRTDMPLDVIDAIDLTMEYDNPTLLDITVWSDASGTVPLDLTVATISATIFDKKGGTGIMPFTVAATAANVVQLTLAKEQVNQLPPACWWSLVASGAGGIITLAEGNISISGSIDLPLVTTTDSWDYVKPATADEPLSGQIVHCNIAQNTLRISALSQPGTDQMALLSQLVPSDRITIGATTWTIVLVRYNDAGWFDVIVSPIAQDAATGVVPVLFEAAL